MYIYDIEIITAEFVSRIVDMYKNISIINGSAKLQYQSISLRQNIMNKLLIRLLRSKDQDDHNFRSTNYV